MKPWSLVMSVPLDPRITMLALPRIDERSGQLAAVGPWRLLKLAAGQVPNRASWFENCAEIASVIVATAPAGVPAASVPIVSVELRSVLPPAGLTVPVSLRAASATPDVTNVASAPTDVALAFVAERR